MVYVNLTPKSVSANCTYCKGLCCYWLFEEKQLVGIVSCTITAWPQPLIWSNPKMMNNNSACRLVAWKEYIYKKFLEFFLKAFKKITLCVVKFEGIWSVLLFLLGVSETNYGFHLIDPTELCFCSSAFKIKVWLLTN